MNIDVIDRGTQKGAAAVKDNEEERVLKDLLYIYTNHRMYINEKGYLQKLVELLYELGYYEDNESLFTRR